MKLGSTWKTYLKLNKFAPLRLSAEATHDIRNSISSVLLTAEYFSQEKLISPLQLDQIRRHGGTLVRLLDQEDDRRERGE